MSIPIIDMHVAWHAAMTQWHHISITDEQYR